MRVCEYACVRSSVSACVSVCVCACVCVRAFVCVSDCFCVRVSLVPMPICGRRKNGLVSIVCAFIFSGYFL